MSHSTPASRKAGQLPPVASARHGTPAYDAVMALGAAPDPDPRNSYQMVIGGENLRVQTAKSAAKAAAQVQRKAYMKSVRDAVKNGLPIPPAPEGMTEPPDVDEKVALVGRVHTEPKTAASVHEPEFLSAQLVPAEAAPTPVYPPFPGMNAPNGWGMPVASSGWGQLQMLAAPVKLSDAIRPFLRHISQKQYSRSAIGDHMLTFRIFGETVGNKHLHELSNADTDDFLDVLGNWPTNATVRKAFREMRAPEVAIKAARLGVPTLCLKTQQRHVDRMRSFFRWCERRRELFPGLLDGVRLYRKSQDFAPGRDVYTDDEARVIFGVDATRTMTTPFHYWAPRLAYYLGMRVNEIGQLYVADIQTIDGVPCIEVTKERAGQRLKNRYSHRTLPIHPVLLGLGFLDFVEQARSFGRETLFPGVSWGTNGPGDTVGDWFNGAFLRKTCKIADRAKTFHSFRHTFATLAERSRLPDGRIALALGHSAGKTILREHYIKPPTVDEKMTDLLAIRFPDIPHPAYDREQFQEAFEKDAAMRRRKRLLDEVYGTGTNPGRR